MKYYSLNNILKKNAQYNIVFGERSNGKSYAAYKHGLQHFCKTGKQMAVIRRWDEDFKSKRAATMFDALIANGEVLKATDGRFDQVFYQSGRWTFCRWDESTKSRVLDSRPFAYAFSLSSMQHDKSTSYPDIQTVVFDEFLTRGVYIQDEFVTFMNVLSTIIRERNDVQIFMLGNAVNIYSPYFEEMGLTHIKQMKPGDIDVYEYGDSGLRVAVEFADSQKNGKKSDIYFAFDNPKLHMITGQSGIWEIPTYPHCPCKYKPSDIKFTYFIKFDNELLQCELVRVDKNVFTFIHRKTSPLQDEDRDIIYSPDVDYRPNHRVKITKCTDALDKKLAWFYNANRVFYQDNTVGEIVRNYLVFCSS